MWHRDQAVWTFLCCLPGTLAGSWNWSWDRTWTQILLIWDTGIPTSIFTAYQILYFHSLQNPKLTIFKYQCFKVVAPLSSLMGGVSEKESVLLVLVLVCIVCSPVAPCKSFLLGGTLLHSRLSCCLGCWHCAVECWFQCWLRHTSDPLPVSVPTKAAEDARSPHASHSSALFFFFLVCFFNVEEELNGT